MADAADRSELLLSAWALDASLFNRDLISEPMYPWQEHVLDAFSIGARRVAAKAARGSGKTTLAARVALWSLCTTPDSLVAVITPVRRQSKHGVMTELSRLWNESPRLRALYPDFEISDFEVRTSRAGWRLVAWSADADLGNLEGLHGRQGVTLICDEAKGIGDGAWTRLQPMMRTSSSRCLAVSTPGARSGWFWDIYNGGNREAFDATFSITLENTPHLREVAEREARRVGEDAASYRRDFLGDFIDDSEDALYSAELLDSVRGIDPDGPHAEGLLGYGTPRRKFGGFDPSGLGKDDSTLCVIHRGDSGSVVKKIIRLAKADPMLLCSSALMAARAEGLEDLAVDAIGLGGPLASRLREMAGRKPFVTNYVASERGFLDSAANLKTAIGLRARDLMLERKLGIDLPDADFQRLSRELCSLGLTSDPRTGKVRILDPAKSPDFADSFFAALSLSVVPPSICVGRVAWLA